MDYDFSEYFTADNEEILNEFIDKYTSLIDSTSSDNSEIIDIYKNILDTFSSEFEEDYILNIFESLAEHELVLKNPYAITINEIHCLKNLLIKQAIAIDSNKNIFNFYTLFDSINNKVADIYLKHYIEKLLNINSMRINSLSNIVDKNIIKHYEDHLLWLSELAKFIKSPQNNTIPKLNEHKCDFGMWLYANGKSTIQNDIKYNSIMSIHSELHIFASKIQKHINNNEQHILLTYLEKCELISLNIGTELALIDNVIMSTKVTKDVLTGAMSRNGLENIFHSQYELSFSTGNSFVLAMCDLDFFKSVNDTYGHIIGDKVLKHFVDVCKEFTRNSDIIIRYGGEEFILILPAIGKVNGYIVLEKIRKEFEKKLLLDNNQEISCTVSIGLIEVVPKERYRESYITEYIQRADQKLYSAKDGGRNRVEAY